MSVNFMYQFSLQGCAKRRGLLDGGVPPGGVLGLRRGPNKEEATNGPEASYAAAEALAFYDTHAARGVQ